MSSRAPKAVSTDGGSALFQGSDGAALKGGSPGSSVGIGSASSEMRQTSAWAASTDPASGMPAAPRRSSSRQPRCRAWSTAVTSAGHHRLDWRVSARSAPTSSASREVQAVVKVWSVSAWAATAGVRCRLIRHHTAAAA